MKNFRNGFTLIELLVVIAIIAILAAILFPVFAKVREKARQTNCMSNEKELGFAMNEYVQDYDEVFPLVEAQNASMQSNWGQNIYSYVKSTGMFRCPDNPNYATSMPNGSNPGAGIPQLPTSFAYNYQIANTFASGATWATPPGNNGTPISISFVNSPSQKIIICETLNDFGAAYPDWSNNGFGGTTKLFAGHTGLMDCLFIDGHVKALKPTATATPVNMWGNMSSNSTSDGPGCGNNVLNINCDAPTTALTNALATVQAEYK
jgi:prepilin-type N-terminal cleavage/methylation domain-containing protein/prepilin-type processing-associated H-X9-DG protein